jgi:hypothetical protein
MNYSAVNKALAKEFGKGQVEVRRARGQEWEYTLWFHDDDTPREVMERAKGIVNRFEPTYWMDDKIFHTDK